MPSVYQFRQAAMVFLLSLAEARLKNHFGPDPGLDSLRAGCLQEFVNSYAKSCGIIRARYHYFFLWSGSAQPG